MTATKCYDVVSYRNMIELDDVSELITFKTGSAVIALDKVPDRQC
jgi:hypothetical protein